MEALKQKVKPVMKLSEDILDIRYLKTNVVLEQLEENIKLREQPIEMHARKRLLRN